MSQPSQSKFASLCSRSLQLKVCRPAASASAGDRFEMHSLRPYPRPLPQKLHFSTIPREFACTIRLEDTVQRTLALQGRVIYVTFRVPSNARLQGKILTDSFLLF